MKQTNFKEIVQEYKQRGVRKNGFSIIFGPNYYQIISWIYCMMDILLAYIFILQLPKDQLHFQIGLLIWQTLLTIIITFSCLLATATDTTDQTLIEQRKAIKAKFNQLIDHYTLYKSLKYQTTLTSFCTVCTGPVQTQTKHCGNCNKQMGQKSQYDQMYQYFRPSLCLAQQLHWWQKLSILFYSCNFFEFVQNQQNYD